MDKAGLKDGTVALIIATQEQTLKTRSIVSWSMLSVKGVAVCFHSGP